MLDTAREWYLFRELLPVGVDADQYATAEELLDALTADARAQGMDRFFSYVTTRQADDAILQEGQFVGFGFRSHIEDGRLWLTDVYEGGPAARRGPVARHGDHPRRFGRRFRADGHPAEEDPGLGEAFGPATEGVERGMRFVPPGGAAGEAVFTKAVVTIPPVPAGGARILALPSNPSVPVGYLSLRTFTTTAEAPLREAYADFRAQGVEYFIVDLRYNGGGLVRIAEIIGDLNGGSRRLRRVSADAVQYGQVWPEQRAPLRSAAGIGRAGARRLHHDRAYRLGQRDRHQFARALDGGCDRGRHRRQARRAVRVRRLGLRHPAAPDHDAVRQRRRPGRTITRDWRAACLLPVARRDDLMREPGDEAEGSTAEALAWLGTGACTEVLPPDSRFRKAAAGFRVPQARTDPRTGPPAGNLLTNETACSPTDGQLATVTLPQRRIPHGHLEGHCSQGFEPA